MRALCLIVLGLVMASGCEVVEWNKDSKNDNSVVDNSITTPDGERIVKTTNSNGEVVWTVIPAKKEEGEE